MPTHSQRLIHAVRTENHDRLRELIEHHGDVDTRSAAGRTALHAAAEEGDVESARILVAARCDVNARMQGGQTPLHLAASYGGYCDLTDLDKDRADPCNRGRHHPINLQVAEAMTEILKVENPEVPRHLTPMADLPPGSKSDVFRSLLECMTEPAELYRKIVVRGIDLDKLDPHFSEFLRGRPRYLRMVEFLLELGADINAVDESGSTVLHGAVELGRPEMVELLLIRGAKLSTEPDEVGETVIDSALGFCKTDVADVLLRHGATLDSNPWRLVQAAANGRLSVVQWLLDHGTDINARDENGDTALMAAGGHHDVVACLLARQADPRVRNNRGRTVLHESACWPKSLDFILPLGLNVNEADEEGATPLHLAARGEDPVALKMLINAGASLDVPDHAGNTPLHTIFFSEEFRPDVEFPTFHALVAAGANRSIRNQEGKSGFDLATQYEYPIEYLDLLQPSLAGKEHADTFIWLGDERYLDFLPKALVSVELDGRQWSSCDHYFHAQKTDDLDVREQICQAATGAEALGCFRDAGLKPPGDWPQRCDEIMRRVLLAKFQQHAPLRQRLIETGTATLISDSNCEWYWVERPNVVFSTIGRMLMSIREELGA